MILKTKNYEQAREFYNDYIRRGKKRGDAPMDLDCKGVTYCLIESSENYIDCEYSDTGFGNPGETLTLDEYRANIYKQRNKND